MDLNTPVSMRMFAKMVGISSDNSVRKAVERSSIVEGVTPEGKIIPSIAAREWGKEILPEFDGGKPAAPAVKKPPVVKKPKKEKPDAVTFDEVVREVMSEKLAPISKDDLENIDEDEPEETSDTVQKPEAERQAAILKVKILRLSYMEKRGQMVPISKVNSVLFSYGQEIRTALEGMPNRIVDKLLASKNRHDAKKIFDKEIYETLSLLADIQNRTFE